jgi:hypothetical protein
MIANIEASGAGAGEPLGRLVFACGAAYEVKGEPMRDKKGGLARLLVAVQGKDSPASPKLAGREMSCLHGCPARVRDSHRLQQRAWVGDAAVQPTGEPVWCVLCKPVAFSPAAAPEVPA